MTTSVFPTALDSFTDPTATSKTNVLSHAAQHTLENDALAAIQTLIGITGSTSGATMIGQIAALATRPAGSGGSSYVYFA